VRIRRVLDPVDVLIDGQNRRVELAAERGISRPDVEPELHALRSIVGVGLGGRPRHAANFDAVHTPCDILWGPLVRIDVVPTTQIGVQYVPFRLELYGIGEDGVRLQMAPIFELLEVEFVPQYPLLFRLVLPQEEGAHDAGARGELDARCKAPVLIPRARVDLSAGYRSRVSCRQ